MTDKLVNDMRETPPPPATTGLKEWFAGLALGNPEIMRDVPPEKRVEEAVRLASELISALAQPRTPSTDVFKVPTVTELTTWSEKIEHRTRATVPEMPAVKHKHRSSMLPPPCPQDAHVSSFPLSEEVSSIAELDEPCSTEGPGRYSYATPAPEKL